MTLFEKSVVSKLTLLISIALMVASIPASGILTDISAIVGLTTLYVAHRLWISETNKPAIWLRIIGLVQGFLHVVLGFAFCVVLYYLLRAYSESDRHVVVSLTAGALWMFYTGAIVIKRSIL